MFSKDGIQQLKAETEWKQFQKEVVEIKHFTLIG